VIRLAKAAVAALLINGVLLATAAQLVRERPRRLDVSEATVVSLVTVPREDVPPEERERRPPAPPRPRPRLDFVPELTLPAPDAPDLAGPAVVLDPALFGRVTPAGDLVFEAAELDRAPRSLVRTTPRYPYRARQRRIEGEVRVRFLVGADGAISRVSILAADPPEVFDRAVLEAVRGWRFEPGVIDGEPVASWVVTSVLFDMDGER
jgi:protein TonB